MVDGQNPDQGDGDDRLFLPQVRRMEAVSFRSFPSTTTHYDGTWAIRLTAGHPAKRLNSVNPLDPSDHADIEKRLAVAGHRFKSFGRPLVFRQSPLAPVELENLFDEKGWERFEESIVMVTDLTRLHLDGEIDQVPMKDTGRWVDGFLALSDEGQETKPGLVEVISSIQASNGLFAINSGEAPVAAVRCVRENELAGIFDLVTGIEHQRKGHARKLVGSALKWARNNGARTGWLQVVASNEAAIGLYESLGFEQMYRYSYRRPAALFDGSGE